MSEIANLSPKYTLDTFKSLTRRLAAASEHGVYRLRNPFFDSSVIPPLLERHGRADDSTGDKVQRLVGRLASSVAVLHVAKSVTAYGARRVTDYRATIIGPDLDDDGYVSVELGHRPTDGTYKQFVTTIQTDRSQRPMSLIVGNFPYMTTDNELNDNAVVGPTSRLFLPLQVVHGINEALEPIVREYPTRRASL